VLKLLELAHQQWPSFKWSAHHHLIATELEQIVLGNNSALSVSTPPQVSKSTLCAQTLPAYYLMQYPSRNVIIATYEAGLAETHSERAMSIVRDHGWLTGVSLGHRQAISRWQTDRGGQVVAGSIYGGLTGKSADLIVIDDP